MKSNCDPVSLSSSVWRRTPPGLLWTCPSSADGIQCTTPAASFFSPSSQSASSPSPSPGWLAAPSNSWGRWREPLHLWAGEEVSYDRWHRLPDSGRPPPRAQSHRHRLRRCGSTQYLHQPGTGSSHSEPEPSGTVWRFLPSPEEATWEKGIMSLWIQSCWDNSFVFCLWKICKL